MADKQCEFLIVRYYSDPIRDEAINIGIIIVPNGTSNERTPQVRFTKDWSRVRCLDPDADTEMLSEMEGFIRQQIAEEGIAGIEFLFDRMSTTLRLERAAVPGEVSISRARVVLTNNCELEMDRLMALYVERR